jgi:hypothetical protein
MLFRGKDFKCHTRKGKLKVVKRIETGNSSNNPRVNFLRMSSKAPEKTMREPTPSDYMAAAFIVNGIVWGWMQILGSGTIISRLPLRVLSDITYVVYLVAGAVGAILVGNRADTKHLLVGLKSSGYSLVISILIMLTSAPDPTLGLLLALGIAFAAGSIFGSYRVVHLRLAAKRKERKARLEQEKGDS